MWKFTNKYVTNNTHEKISKFSRNNVESQNCVSKRARFRVGDGWCNSQASKKAIEVVIEVINRGEVVIDIQREQFTDVMLIR